MSRFFFTLEILRDGAPVGGPVGLETPLQLGVEALRWRCLCQGGGGFDPGRLKVAPVWHQDGDPFVEAIEFATAGREAVVALDARRLYADEARKTSARLVQEDKLKEGDRYDYRIRARDRGAGETPHLDLLHYEVREGGERPPVAGLSDPGRADPADCFDVVVDPVVLAEAGRLSREAGASETGGLLGGHLLRGCGPVRVPYLHITVVVPAGGGGERAAFRFTPAAWNRGRAALEDRGSGEIMCGWFHSHPPDLCPPSCPPGKRENCALRHPFLSGDDRLVHRAAFPAPFNIALLVSDDGDARHVPSVWGWRNGVIARRAYHLTQQAS